MSSIGQPSAPLYPNERAFVVKFRGDAFDEGETVAGCVEHIVSARGQRFNNADEMLTFFREMIARPPTLAARPDGETENT